ncbi:hypothetical protein M5U04_07050 [Xenorhabdus sp. XENO-1]|nr:hypothetical protein [Xenorhabdus bovienii subsp. africana]
MIKNNYRVVNGFGWGVGSAVINGALDSIYSSPEKFSEEQLIIRPFPQVTSNKKDLHELWEIYRQRMLSLAGVSLFIFGNKKDGDGGIVDAKGVYREFEISVGKNIIPIPLSSTGYMAAKIYKEVKNNPSKYYCNNEWIIPALGEISNPNISSSDVVKKIVNIINKLNRK